MSPRCFMIQPFDGGKFDKRFEDVFAPAVKAAGMDPYRVDRDAGVSIPIDDIERGISESAACFVDVTVDNPNVWFELGYSIAARKDLCLVCSSERTEKYPFDIQHRSIVRYSSDSRRDFDALAASITARLKAILDQQATRADIQVIAAEPSTAGLTDYVASCLACIGSIVGGVEEAASNWAVRNEMEKAGYNSLACNVALRELRAKRLATPKTAEDRDGQYEGHAVTDAGWDWIVRNTHSLNLKVTSRKSKGFAKALDDEIPF